MNTDLTSILIRPHITEKATASSETSVYIFEVPKLSTKGSIAKAFSDKYKVTPIKINTVTTPAKNVIVRGKRGKTSSFKKAYIYIKKGEKIEIM